jgi:hypothetical protein
MNPLTLTLTTSLGVSIGESWTTIWPHDEQILMLTSSVHWR